MPEKNLGTMLETSVTDISEVPIVPPECKCVPSYAEKEVTIRLSDTSKKEVSITGKKNICYYQR